MIPTTLEDIARAAGARLVGADPAAVVTAEVEVDSRQVRPGGLFVALRGERTDGHEHAAAAVEAGAVAVLAERELPGIPCLVVPDGLAALQALAQSLFAVDQPLTFGITGSSGKTSTKDLLAQVLGGSAAGGAAGRDATLAPRGSFNNELGLPLTVLRRSAETRFAVLEYSARGVGHIAFLCGIARPHIGIVLNVGSAHLGEFGSPAAIAQAKGELAEAARDLVVLNADDQLVRAMAGRASAPVVTFGESGGADYRAAEVRLDDDGRATFVLHAPQGSAPVALALHGEHHVSNALAVAAAVLGSGALADVQEVAELLGKAGAVSRWRMEVRERADGVTVVNDAYNANPESMRAALKTLAVMSRGKTRRTWAVLGPMAELGEGARDAHFELGRHVVRLDLSRLVAVGDEAGGIHAGAVLEGSWGSESVHVDGIEAAVQLLEAELAPGDVVLVKASRSAGLERLAAALLDEGASA